MKKSAKLLFVSVLAFSLAASVPVAAADYANVVLNGKAISYTDPLARPQIIGGKTMVPFRDYAEALGIVIQYNPDTKTMSFTQDGNTFSHVSGTSTATINGKVTDHLTPSANINGYTMMPLTMLLEAIGADYDWNDATKTVNIVTTPEETPFTAAPSVIKATSDPSSVDSGQVTKITVITTGTSDKVKLVQSTINGPKQVAETTTYTINNDGTRTFILDWTPVNPAPTTFMAVKAVAGNASGYVEDDNAVKSVSVIVKYIAPPKLSKVELRDDSITVDETADLIVTANQTVEKVRLSNDQNDTVTEFTDYAVISGERRFVATVKLSKVGTVKLTLEAAGVGGYDASLTQTKTVTVKADSKYDDTDVVIEKVTPTQKKVQPGGSVMIRANSTLGVEEVRILADDSSFVRVNTPTTVNADVNQKIWEIRLSLPDDVEDGDECHYELYGVGGGRATKHFDINIDIDEDAEDNSLEFISANYDRTIKLGNKTEFVLTTSYGTDRLKVEDITSGSAKVVYTTSSPTRTNGTGGTKRWDFKLDVPGTGNNTFRITIYDSNGDYDSEEYDVYTSPTANGGVSS